MPQYVVPDLNPSDNRPSQGPPELIPLVVHLPLGSTDDRDAALADAELTIDYPYSDPGAVTYTGTGTGDDPYVYGLPADRASGQVDGLRLWTGGAADRTTASFVTAVDPEADPTPPTLSYCVPPAGAPYSGADLRRLGFSSSNDVTLYVEAVKPSALTGDQEVTLTFDPGDGSGLQTDKVHLTSWSTKLKIDSDNSSQPGASSGSSSSSGGSGGSGGSSGPALADPELPSDTPAQQKAAHDPNSLGKILVVNDGDKNGNGVPDLADGYNLNPNTTDDDSNPKEHFVPLVIELPAGADPQNTYVKLTYSGSDPGRVRPNGLNTDHAGYVPDASGFLRLWKKVGSPEDALGQASSSSSPSPQPTPRTIADYVRPGERYTAAQLGYQPGKPLVLYVEAVRASAAGDSGMIRSEVTALVGPGTAAMPHGGLATKVLTRDVHVTAIGGAAMDLADPANVLGGEAAGSTGGNAAAMTFSGAVNLSDGTISLPATTDIESDGFGQPWGVTRSWTNRPGLTFDNQIGHGWVVSQMPTLVQGDSTVVEVASGRGARYFDYTYDDQGKPVYKPRYNTPDALAYDAGTNTYTLTDTLGNQTTFNGFGKDDSNAAPHGAFLKYTDNAGNITAATYSAVETGTQQSAYRLDTVTRSGAGGQGASETWTYTYNDPTWNPDGTFKALGLLNKVELSRSNAGDGSGVVRTAEYEYYDYGLSSDVQDLRRVTIKDAGGNVVGRDGYTYWGPGGVIRDVFTSAGFRG